MKKTIIKRCDLLGVGLGQVLAFNPDEIVFVGIPKGKTLGEPFVKVKKPSDYGIGLPKNYILYRAITSLEDSEIENLIKGG